MAITMAPPPPPGIYTPCVTFFKEDESVDLEAIKAHALRMAEGGCAGLVIQGSNGEAVHLDHDERSAIISTVRKALDEKGYHIPLIVGCGMQSGKETVLLTQKAKAAGGQYALVLPASYWANAMTKPTLLAFFKYVADRSPLPILIYNFPAVANGINIDSDMIIELAKHPNIVGCKLTCGVRPSTSNEAVFANHDVRISETCTESSLTQSQRSSLRCRGKAKLRSTVSSAARLGVFRLQPICMSLSPSTCLTSSDHHRSAPKAHVALYQAVMKGDLKRARELQNIISDADLAQQKLGVSGMRYAVTQYFGYGAGHPRIPMPQPNVAVFEANKPVLDELIALEKSL